MRKTVYPLLTAYLFSYFTINPCQAFSIFSLTPQTTPEEIVTAQLKSLQNDDMLGVFDFASTSNKANVNNDLDAFDRMVRQGAYRCLVQHQQAEILLTTRIKSPTSGGVIWRGLVRVVPKEEVSEGEDEEEEEDYVAKKPGEPTKEYWWTLSRCNTGYHKGCYMVDAVIPAK